MHSEIGVTRLKNELYMRFIEFAPILLKHLRYEELKSRPDCLRNVSLQLSVRQVRAVGMCYPEKRKIVLNQNYFLKNPQYLPYTLYHELVHLFLFDAGRPWGHTKEFYLLMEDFPVHKHPLDPNVHIHEQRAHAGAALKRKKDSEISQLETLSQFIERVFGAQR